MTARSANAPSVVIDVEAAADDNGKYRSYGGSTAACASAVRSCFNTHGARFGSTGIALVRWVVEYQFFAARRLFRSCMSNLDRAELSARLASAEQRRLELQEALALSLNSRDTAGAAGAAAAQEHALRNYELFHQLKRGSATYAQVAASSAGIDAWAMNPQTAQHEAEADGWPEARNVQNRDFESANN